MFTVYINEKPLILTSTLSIRNSWHSNSKILISPYIGKSKQLLQFMDMLSKNPKCDKVIIHHKNKKFLKSEFLKLVNVIHAGGGLVFNQKNELLVIFRRGNWDLPKGKIEHEEPKRLGAIREVMEETGIDGARIESKLGKTYHLFKNKSGKKSLKVSHWYVMSTKYEDDLVPQIEEDIEKADWVDPKVFLKSHKPMYNNIHDIVSKYLKTQNSSI